MITRRSFSLGTVATAILGEAAWAVGGTPETYQQFRGSAPPPLKGTVRKSYVDSTWGQMHYWHARPVRKTRRPPVVFFHPNPFSGTYFKYALEEIGRDRVAIAFDTPGYGESAPPPGPQSMEPLVASFATALENLGYGSGTRHGKVDVSGFHTGACMAAELAAARPDLVRKVVLGGVPFWENEKRESMRKELLVEKPLTEDGASVMREWRMWAVSRNKLLPLERGHELFCEAVRPGARSWWAYQSIVTYDMRPRLESMRLPVLLVNPAGESMAVTTRQVLPLLRQGTILEVPHLPHQIYDLAVDAVGQIYRDFLDA